MGHDQVVMVEGTSLISRQRTRGDDVEALEQCQRGFRNSAEAQWNDISKGMGKPIPDYDDELQMRAFWSNWNKCVFQEPA